MKIIDHTLIQNAVYYSDIGPSALMQDDDSARLSTVLQVARTLFYIT